MAPENTVDLFYIMGSSFSGSTLLTNLLAMHPRIATVGELKASAIGNIDTYTCSCGSLLRECSFWQQVRQQMDQQGVGFPFGNYGLHFCDEHVLCNRLLRAGYRRGAVEQLRKTAIGFIPKCRKRYRQVLENNRIAMEVIRKIQGGDIFLDGSKDPNRLNFFLESRYWKIKVLYIIRDGRGSTNSSIRHHNDPMAVTAAEWVQMQTECDRLAAANRERCFIMRYEDFCKDPDGYLAKIYRFIGLEPPADASSFSVRSQHILGNSMRLSSTSAIRLDERWRQSLTGENLAIFERIAGRLNRSYGYE